MNSALLLLADSRLPAGGHAHSGGLEPVATTGVVTDVDGLADFLRGRLATTGLVAAALAAAACAYAAYPIEDQSSADWSRLAAEADARTPSPAQRTASRAQGRALLRVAGTAWPHPALDALAAGIAARDHGGPHHPVALGAAVLAAGGTPEQAAGLAAYGAVTGPAAAAVRLLGLDPLAVHRVLADLADQVDAVAAQGARAARRTDGRWPELPAVSAPRLDLLAELHLRSEVRLFES